jgi:hypothetical protein
LILKDDHYFCVLYQRGIFFANDNGYGLNSIHWETRPNGMRGFGDIWESDKGELFSIGVCSGDGGLARSGILPAY